MRTCGEQGKARLARVTTWPGAMITIKTALTHIRHALANKYIEQIQAHINNMLLTCRPYLCKHTLDTAAVIDIWQQVSICVYTIQFGAMKRECSQLDGGILVRVL